MKVKAKNLDKVRVEPGDVIVLRVAAAIDAGMHELLQKQLTEYFPNNRTIVLSGDVSLDVYTGGAVL